MKTWWLKWRISSASDDRKPLPASLEKALGQSAEACEFAAKSDALARVLKDELPTSEVSPALHASIMRAVRNADRTVSQQNRFFWLRRPQVAGLAVLVLSGILVTVHLSSRPDTKMARMDSSSLAAAGSVLELGDDLVCEVPSAAMSPMYEEMQSLNRDLDGTQKFLLASLP